MSEFDRIIKEKQELLETADNDLIAASQRAQRQLWGLIIEDFESMETDSDGRIRLTQRNIEIAARIVNRLKLGLGSTDFAPAMQDFLSKFDRSIQINQEYARQFNPSYRIADIQVELMRQSKIIAVDLLTNEGYKSRIDQTFRVPLNAALQGGSNLRETIRSLREIVQGDGKADGRVLANVKTYANTTFATADRTLSNTIYKDLSIEWFRYVGGEIDTTRKFCEERTGKYFHKLEIEQWGNDEWSGQIEGTNSENIFVVAGGWNCRHSIMGVPIARVPPDVIERAKSKGFYIEK
jgi:hypothetical protein